MVIWIKHISKKFFKCDVNHSGMAEIYLQIRFTLKETLKSGLPIFFMVSLIFPNSFSENFLFTHGSFFRCLLCRGFQIALRGGENWKLCPGNFLLGSVNWGRSYSYYWKLPQSLKQSSGNIKHQLKSKLAQPVWTNSMKLK